MFTIDRKSPWNSDERAPLMEKEPSGETWSGKSTSNQDLVLSCFGRMDVKGLHGHRSVHQPEGEHYTRHWVTRRKVTQKTDADTNAKARSGRRSIVSSWLSSKFVRKENVSVLSLSPQRFICKCHTCQIVSNCASRRCHIFPRTEKTSRSKWQSYPLILILFYFWVVFWSSTGKGILKFESPLQCLLQIKSPAPPSPPHRCVQMLQEPLCYTSADRQYSVTSQPRLGLSLIKNVCLDDTVLSLTSCDHVICPKTLWKICDSCFLLS